MFRTLAGGRLSRREFLASTAALPFLLPFHGLAAAERKRVKIRDVQIMVLGRAHLHAGESHRDDGLYGIGEAYGSPGVGVKEQVLSLKPWLVGKDPLEIDALYTRWARAAQSAARAPMARRTT